jgi:uncharacterized repeat protein (TIGR03803 family)
MRRSFALLEFPSRRFFWRELAMVLLTIMATVTLSAAATEKILHSFNPWPQGWQPSGGLIADAAGNLYGMTSQGGAHYFGAVYELTPNSHGGWRETVLYSFTGGDDGNGPVGPLLFDESGNLYGATIGGGVAQGGTIFKLTPLGNGQWTESVLWDFHGEDGLNPNGGLVFDAAGNLYGVTSSGGGLGERTCGQGGCGIVFRLTPEVNGKWPQTILYHFQGKSDGANPTARLLLGSGGQLYGSTEYGGDVTDSRGYGVVYELADGTSGWTESVLYTFTDGPDGGYPSPVIFDDAGNLYGTTASGGTGTACEGFPCGTVFELVSSGAGFTERVIYNFNFSDGQAPEGILTFDRAGSLYGTTYAGGTADLGTVFGLSREANGRWSENVLWNFTGGNDGANPYYGVTLGTAGQIYGTTIRYGGATGNGTAFELTSSANGQWMETTISHFADGSGNGPTTNLTADAAGNFYGTTAYGGTNGAGSVYELTPAGSGMWNEKILYSFAAGGLANGGTVTSPSNLILDAAGNLYGETEYGGLGNGTVFELSPVGGSWTEKDIYTFAGGKDGTYPQGGLIFDQAGNLYGTTQLGGTGGGCPHNGCGTVFELSASGGGWGKKILYNFAGGTTDGSNPVAGVVFDGAGNLYGTTLGGGPSGGNNNCGIGCGGVFELAASNGGWKETPLYFFTEKHGDGALPYGGLVVDTAGNLYGTTRSGGLQNEACGIGCGTVFEISPASGGWSESVLYQFPEFFGPLAGLVSDRAGNLYGTNAGTVFELSPASGGGWSETTLYTFGSSGSEDGADPEASLILDGAGNLYGTTIVGGSAGGGTVFEITP